MVKTKQVGVSKTQMEFIKNSTKYTAFCGGIGSGKTHAGGLWSTMMTRQYPGVTGIITANTYGQLQKATLPKFLEMLDNFGISYHYKQQANEVIVEKTTKILLYSMDKYDNMRGPEAGWAWSDEFAFYKKEAFDVLMGRIRGNKGPLVWKGSTTPNGYNWVYDFFVKDTKPSRRIIFSSTMDNAGNLGNDYIKDLQDQYDTRLARQELEGKFVNLSEGKVYHAFDREVHVREFTVDFNRLITMGLDFNVHPMCGVYCVQVDGVIHVFDELYQTNSNTFKAAKEIKDKYGNRYIQIACDSTGDRRRSSSQNTDHDILRQARLDVVPFRNPYERDRFNNLNRLFEKGRLVIHPNCVELINDLEQLVHDNKDDMLSHSSDALGYACWHLAPMKKPKRPARTYTY